LTNPDHKQFSAAQLSKDRVSGLLLPITTPFRANDELDLEGLSSNIRRWNETGIGGYIVLGSTGERVNLDESEQLSVFATAREESGQRIFIAGVGQQSTRGTIDEMERVAREVTVDAFLVITPHFYRPSITQEALAAHYERVADNSPAPLVLYSMPALTGIRIEPETAARLSEHENMIGIKDSSADLEGLRETIRLVRPDFAVLTGNGTVLSEALRAGACGGILAVGCVAAELCLEIFRAMKAGETDLAARLQSQLTPLATAVTTRFGIGGLKAALEMKGYVGGGVRAPLRAPDEAALAEIRACLDGAASEVRSQRSEVRSQ
jgi:4-hydroxy-2-oxoglutarate aldolase